MALISCPECSREVSDQAAACPHCGYPLSPRRTATAQPPDPDQRIKQVLLSGGKIAAIQLCRELTPGLGLADAKRHVDGLQAGLPEALRQRTGGAGCLGVILGLALVAGVLGLDSHVRQASGQPTGD